MIFLIYSGFFMLVDLSFFSQPSPSGAPVAIFKNIPVYDCERYFKLISPGMSIGSCVISNVDNAEVFFYFCFPLESFQFFSLFGSHGFFFNVMAVDSDECPL